MKERTPSLISRGERSLANSSGLLQNKLWKSAAFCCFKANWQLHSTDGRRDWCGKVLQGQALKNGMWALVYINIFHPFFSLYCHESFPGVEWELGSGPEVWNEWILFVCFVVVFIFKFLFYFLLSARTWVDDECNVAEVHAPLKPPCRHSSKRNYPHLSLLTLLRVHE